MKKYEIENITELFIQHYPCESQTRLRRIWKTLKNTEFANKSTMTYSSPFSIANSLMFAAEGNQIIRNAVRGLATIKIIFEQAKHDQGITSEVMFELINKVCNELEVIPDVKVKIESSFMTETMNNIQNNSHTASIVPVKEKLIDKKFKVAVSFAGEKRKFVEETVNFLELFIDRKQIFYDNYYKAHLAKPNLDNLLQKIYHDNSELIVVFLCENYDQKEWCGLEWRAIKDLIKQKKEDKIMLFCFDQVSIPGLFSTDGYINLNDHTPEDAAMFINERLT